MKITLIQPPRPQYKSAADKHWQLTRPFSLFFLAAFLGKYTKHEVLIIDLEQKKYKNITLQEIFQNNDSKIFGITATTYTRFEAIKVAKHIKHAHPESRIITGGVHFMYCDEDTLRNVPEIDLVVRGEGEIPIAELSDAIEKGWDLSKIRGITYREKDKIVRNPDQSVFEKLEELPFYPNFSWEEYPEYLFGYPNEVPAVSVMSSRGCPHRCIFCAKAGMKYRLRSPKKVVDEIETLKRQFNVQGINFLDLTFTSNTQHVKDICRELMDRKLNVKWWCESRANMPLSLLELMKQAGCVSLVIGVESGSPEILSKICKDISIEQVIKFCETCRDLEIIVQPYFMFSHPDETKEDVKRTLDLMGKLDHLNASCAFQPAMIFPGTQLESIARRKGILREDFSWSAPYEFDLNTQLGQFSNIPLFLDILTPENLINIMREFNRRHVINKTLKLDLKKLMEKGFNAVRYKKPTLKYIFSPKFYYEYITSRLKR